MQVLSQQSFTANDVFFICDEKCHKMLAVKTRVTVVSDPELTGSTFEYTRGTNASWAGLRATPIQDF